MAKKVLIVDDDPFAVNILHQELTEAGYEVASASNGEGGLEQVNSVEPDLILLDYMLPGMNGLEVLKKIREMDNSVPVIIITAHGTIERAVDTVKAGAFDLITKPFETDHVLITISNALHRQQIQRSLELLSGELNSRYSQICGSSPKIQAAINTSRKVARSNSTVLLLGESGTGKEIFARAIHQWSDRKEQPLIVVNCVALSGELLESELFGHEKGAFTGAHQLKKGKMELADGGTIFLDEVGEIASEQQTKLLRFLQEREFERVGGTKQIKVNARVIAATNRDLVKAVADGTFRKDLFFRLNVVPIVLPPLRERQEDIRELASFFLHRFSLETGKTFSAINDEAMSHLLAYEWPGNVRELANAIERAVVLGESPTLGVSDLPHGIVSSSSTITSQQHASTEVASYHEAVENFKRELVRKTLDDVEGNRSAAARALNLQRTYFSKLIKSLGLSR